MAKVISIEEFLKDTLKVKSERLHSLLQEVDAYAKWEVWNKAEVEEYEQKYREKYKVEYSACCPLCENEFEDDEKIHTEYNFITDDDGEGFSRMFFHEDCFNVYLEDKFDLMDIDEPEPETEPEINPNICALCEIEFDNELSYTDGEAYFCEECAQELSEVFKRDE